MRTKFVQTWLTIDGWKITQFKQYRNGKCRNLWQGEKWEYCLHCFSYVGLIKSIEKIDGGQES